MSSVVWESDDDISLVLWLSSPKGSGAREQDVKARISRMQSGGIRLSGSASRMACSQ